MIGNPPRRPGGESAKAQFFQWVYDNVISMNKVGSEGEYTITSGGVVLGRGGRDGDTSTANVEMLKLRAVEDDYLICRTWDGTTIGADDIKVAKQPKHRISLEGEYIYGNEYAYTYAFDSSEPANTLSEAFSETGPIQKLNKVRTVTMLPPDDDPEAPVDPAEIQRIIPPWLKGDVVFAIEAPDTGVDDAPDYLYIGDSRQWARADEL